MRIVELRLNGHDGPALELHPQITVVKGAESAATRRVVLALEAVCRAQVPEIPTTIAAHGLLVDATPPILDVLGLNPDVAPVITSLSDEEAAGPNPSAASAAPAEEGRERLGAARAAYDQSADALAAAEQQFADAEARADRLRAELEATEGGAGAPSEHDRSAAHAALDEAVARRAAAEADLEASPAPDLAAAEAQEQQARARHEDLVTRVDAVASGDSSVDTRRAELERRKAELDEALSQLPHGDIAPVRDALEVWSDVGGDVLATTAHEDDPEAAELVEAREALEQARRELEEAERQARPPVFDPADVAALEEAHRELEEAEERGSRTMAMPAAKRRLKRAQEAEREVLDRMELPSYGAYLMRTSMVSVDPASQHAVQQAKVKLRDAAAHVDEVADRVAHDSARRELAAEDQLREARGEREAAGARLRAALEHAGAAIDEHDLAGSARSWLVQVAEADERRGELVAERDRVAAQIAALDDPGGGASGRAPDEAREEIQPAADELDRARATLAEARDQVARRESAQATVDEARAAEEQAQARMVALDRGPAGEPSDLDALRNQLADAHRQVDEAHAVVDKARVQVEEALVELRRAEDGVRRAAATATPTRQFEGLAHDTAEQLEVYVLARLAAQRSVGRAGSLPLIIDRALDAVPVDERRPTLELLSRMASAVQVVVISDDDQLAAWAEAAGIQRALVANPSGA